MNLNRMEMEILGLWGCPEYAATITRLTNVAALTVDKDAKRLIAGLHDRLLTEITVDKYMELFKRSVEHCEHEKIRQLLKRNDRFRKKRRSKAIAESHGWVVFDGGVVK